MGYTVPDPRSTSRQMLRPHAGASAVAASSASKTAMVGLVSLGVDISLVNHVSSTIVEYESRRPSLATTHPQFPSRPPSTHTPWRGRQGPRLLGSVGADGGGGPGWAPRALRYDPRSQFRSHLVFVPRATTLVPWCPERSLSRQGADPVHAHGHPRIKIGQLVMRRAPF
jgi:hypothetical protein